MNKRISMLILLLVGLLTHAGAQISFSEKMGKMEGVLITSTSGRALKVMSTEKDAPFADVIDKMTNLQTIMSGEKADRQQMVDRFKRVVAENDFEELMAVNNEEGWQSTIYFRDWGSNRHQFALLQQTSRSVRIVVIVGSLTLQDMQKLVKKK